MPKKKQLTEYEQDNLLAIEMMKVLLSPQHDPEQKGLKELDEEMRYVMEIENDPTLTKAEKEKRQNKKTVW